MRLRRSGRVPGAGLFSRMSVIQLPVSCSDEGTFSPAPLPTIKCIPDVITSTDPRGLFSLDYL